MTREKWATLSPEEQRIKVAECAGWGQKTVLGRFGWFPPTNGKSAAALCASGFGKPPYYLNDLNAMHVVVVALKDDPRFEKYMAWLGKVTENNRGPSTYWNWAHATAAQRAEAFVLTMEVE